MLHASRGGLLCVGCLRCVVCFPPVCSSPRVFPVCCVRIARRLPRRRSNGNADNSGPVVLSHALSSHPWGTVADPSEGGGNAPAPRLQNSRRREIRGAAKTAPTPFLRPHSTARAAAGRHHERPPLCKTDASEQSQASDHATAKTEGDNIRRGGRPARSMQP